MKKNNIIKRTTIIIGVILLLIQSIIFLNLNVDISTANSSYGTRSDVDPSDNYDYVIITDAGWLDDFQSLAHWKNKKGIKTNIVSTNWIYYNGGYNGNNDEKIRAFIQDAHSNWGTTYFLLGGDAEYIPYNITQMYIEYYGEYIPVPNDTYYADYDDDWICEVHVGRASVNHSGSDAGGIENFINKILTYEKNPPHTNYVKNIGLFGFDLDDATSGEYCQEYIDNNYIPSNWNVTKVYDSDDGNHKDDVTSAVNSGQHIINHLDHGNISWMGTGWFNHDWNLTADDVDNFSNLEKQSIFYSTGGFLAAFDEENSMGEHFVRNTNGGCVAFISNTRRGWYKVGYIDSLSFIYDRYFFKSLFIDNIYKLGECFSDHKNDAYGMSGGGQFINYDKHIFTSLTLLGDPEMPIWTDNPQTLVVSHPTKISPYGSTPFTVHAEDISGEPIEDAYVCLWKEDEIYQRSLTDNYGNASFNLLPSTPGILYVTVTKHNYIPYENSITTPAILTVTSSPRYGVLINISVMAPNGDIIVYEGITPFIRSLDFGSEATLVAPFYTDTMAFERWITDSVNQSYDQNELVLLVEDDVLLLAKYVLLGDMDGNDILNAYDIDGFILALQDPEGYEDQYPGLDRVKRGDCNRDGIFNAYDIDAFIQLLAGR